MTNVTGSNTLGGTNQSDANDFSDQKFWYEWIELSGAPSTLTTAGFDTSDGTLASGTEVYNAGGTDDLDSFVSAANANTLGDTADLFAVRMTTTLTITNADTYTFDLTSDDGAMIFVDGVAVVSDDSLHAARTVSGSVDLTSGEHEITVIYFERAGQSVLEVDISSTDSGDYPTAVALQDAAVQANDGDDTISGGEGNDTLNGGDGDDLLTGGDGDDQFIVSSGADTISDFGTGETGSIDDNDQSNNDFIDLSAYYNDTSLAAVNDADTDSSNDFGNALGMLRADAADGTIDGVINGTDYSALIGDIDLTLQNSGSAVTGSALSNDNTNVACFTPGTCIATPEGPLPVEQLRIGDLVTTQDNGDQEIRWIGRRHLSQQDLDAYPNLRPVRIRAGALGGGLPEADLIVSPQHRILVSSKIATRLFGVPEVLVAAKQLVSLDGIDALTAPQGVTYIHFMCARHEVVFAAGAPTESMYAGRQALLAMPDAARREIFALFPELINMDPDARPPSARHLPSGRMARKLAKRHKRNNKPVLHGWPESASA